MSEVTMSGPLFTGTLPPLVQNAIGKGMEQAMLLGQRLVQEQLTPGHGVRSGTYRRSVVGTLGSWNKGVVSSPLIYSNWLETGKRNGRQTRFDGYQQFQNATDKLNDGQLKELFVAAIKGALNG